MKVAIDEQIFAIQRFGGISRYFAELSQQFLEHSDLGVDLFTAPTPVFNDYLIRGLHGRPAMPGSYPSTHLRSMARMMLRRRHRARIDVVHHTFYLPRFLRDFPGAKRVVTIYDMIPERFPGSFRRQDFLTSKRQFVDAADEVICISHSTREDMHHFLGDIRSEVRVIHLGVDADFFARQSAPLATWPHEYLLFVGKRGQYKDARTLFSAFSRIKDQFAGLQLVLVGGGALTTGEVSELGTLGIADRVTHQNLADEQMPAAYRHAQAFVFPSRYEGFGLPALEAMASGTPTILCRSASLPEVGGQAAVYFEPGDVDGLAGALQEVLGSQSVRERLRMAGLERAREFPWYRTADQTAAAYSDALAS